MKPWKRRFLLKTIIFRFQPLVFGRGIKFVKILGSLDSLPALPLSWDLRKVFRCPEKKHVENQQISSFQIKNRASLPNFPYYEDNGIIQWNSYHTQLILYYPLESKKHKNQNIKILIHPKFPHHPFLLSPNRFFNRFWFWYKIEVRRHSRVDVGSWRPQDLAIWLGKTDLRGLKIGLIRAKSP